MFDFQLGNNPWPKTLAQTFPCGMRMMTKLGGEAGKESALWQNSVICVICFFAYISMSCMTVKGYCSNCDVSFFVRLPCLLDLTVIHFEFGYGGAHGKMWRYYQGLNLLKWV